MVVNIGSMMHSPRLQEVMWARVVGYAVDSEDFVRVLLGETPL